MTAQGTSRPQLSALDAGLETAWGFVKSMFGMCAAGHVGRFAVTQFGHKVSNGPLWIITNTVCAYAARVHKVDISAFVDDLFNKMNMIPHGPCGGLKGDY